MKNFILTLVLALGTMASFAQVQSLTVRNNYTSAIVVRASIVDTNTCDFVGTVTQTIPAGQFFTFPAGLPANDWYGIRVTAPPVGLGTQASVSSANKCLYTCPTSLDFSNGLTALWDGANNCTSVSVQ